MKKLLCCLLMVWLALMSGGANAYAISDAAHNAAHTHDHASPDKVNQSPVNGLAGAIDDAQESNYSDTCCQTHCGHGHATGLLAFSGAMVWASGSGATAMFRASWADSLTTASIERPKWPFTTPAVVNLLS